jgi:AbrB family looped-hinge helix DNA binding protein
MNDMPKVKMTSKGQVTIPKEVRKRLGMCPGDELEFVEGARGFTVNKRLQASPLASYGGYLKGLQGQDPDVLVTEMRGG